MRVEGARRIGSEGKVKLTLAFDDWKDGHVAPATFELPLPKHKEAEELRGHLGEFELTLNPPPGAGGRGGGVRLITDSKAAEPKAARPTFAISREQATAVIDYLERNRMFENMDDPPPGTPGPGWTVHVACGGPRGGPYSWRFPPDADLASTGLLRHLIKTLDGEAKAAVERLIPGPGQKKE